MSKHKKSDAAKLAELLGLQTPTVDAYESESDIAREAESALAYAEQASAFVRKECKSCGRAFAHTRGAVAYCSNKCRAAGLELIGIKWHWLKPSEERWAPWQAEPLVVPPDALALVDAHLEQSETMTVVHAQNGVYTDIEVPVANVVDPLDLLRELGLD